MTRHAVHDPGAPILETRGLCIRYDGRPALEDVSFAVERGLRVAVVGPNGAGKSTLFKAVAGVLPVREGRVRVCGSEPGGHICISYIPQRSEVDWTFPVSVFDTVLMGRTADLGLFRRSRARDRAFVRECLATVGLADLAGRQIGELSGGQQQRMFIARALAQKAELMLMDAPAGGLDLTAQTELFRLLDGLAQRRVTVMISTHDLDFAARRFERVLLLNRRLIGYGTPEEVLTSERLSAAYAGSLRVVRAPDGTTVMHDPHCVEEHR